MHRRPRRTSPATLAGFAGLIVVCVTAGFLMATVMLPPAGSTDGLTADRDTPSPVPSAAHASRPPSPSPTGSRTAAPATRPPATPAPTASPAGGPTIAQLIGQKLAIRMNGTTPSPALLERIRRGEIGAVVLFGENLTDEPGLIALTGSLQAAARDGGQPPLLVMIDQEGGRIRRLSWAPPALSATRMAATMTAGAIEDTGAATAAILRGDGINVDLAPVEDVPGVAGGFMAAAGRTFGSTAATVSSSANAFASGLVAGGVIPTLKHFPGIGRVLRNTDGHVETVTASAAQLDRDLSPFRAGIAAGMPLVMLSNATYAAWDDENAAGWSPVIGTQVLRDELGFRGVTITDSLAGAAKARGVTEASLAEAAAIAGTDMLMLTRPEAETASDFASLEAAVEAGTIPREPLEASYARILALKDTLQH